MIAGDLDAHRLGVSVIVPSYGRATLLVRCLEAVLAASATVDEVIVVLRPDDSPTSDAVGRINAQQSGRHVRPVDVSEPGVWAAMREGVRAAAKPYVVFIDDDALPMANWCSRVEARFVDGVGAVGGPILNFHGVRTSNSFFSEQSPAYISWRGVPVSKLHGLPAQALVTDVDFLPGSNMAFRREALLPTIELGLPGMAPAVELVLAAVVHSQNLRIVYDSGIRVEHHPGPRAEIDREDRVRYAHDFAYCMSLALSLSGRRLPQLMHGLLGSRTAPGFATLPLALTRGRKTVERWRAAARGRHEARTANDAHVNRVRSI